MKVRHAGKLRFAGLISGIIALAFLLCVPAFAAGNTSYKDVDTKVASEAREKYTLKKGGGRDKVTIMVYMIGSDLESQNGMATADLNEMLYAQLNNNNVNMFIQTGGCKRWRNSIMTAGKNERWRLDSDGLALMERMKGQAMTDPNTLASFIQFCADEAPADRYFLIFWDHGGGSAAGYGYDEKYPNDTMDISEIGKALQKGGVKFDLIGFDACLMATLETAIAVEPYADYMLASEESEPGTGWYYTRWLQVLNNNSSTNTLSLGKQIIDDFTSASAYVSSRVGTTLSLVDLAELKGTVLEKLGPFGDELVTKLKGQDYQAVASARNGAREFAKSQRLDQVDLVDFCNRLGTREAMQLAGAIQDAVKYNKASNIANAYGLSIYFPNSSLKSINSMLNLYQNIGIDPSWSEGIRTYAMLESSGQIAASSGYTYGSSSGSLIDILLGGGQSSYYDDTYQESDSGGLSGGDYQQPYSSYDSMSVEDIYDMLSGGASYNNSGYNNSGYESGYNGSAVNGYSDVLSSLFGGYTTTSGDYYGGSDYSSILGGYNGGYESSYGYDSYDTSYNGGYYDTGYDDGYYDTSYNGGYYDTGYNDSYYDTGYDTGTNSLLSLAAQMLFGRAPVGSETLRLTEKDGEDVLVLSEEKWEQVTAAELNVFVDDGSGFLDLGLDNVAEYNEEGDLIDAWDGTWLTLQGQPCAVYPVSEEDEDGNGLYVTQKFIPALLNGERVNLIIEFNEETGEDRVLGAQSITETGVVKKGFTEMNGGDIITLLCDYYYYDGTFQAQYTLGDPIIVPEDCVLTIVNKELTGSEDMRMLYTYRLTDLYQAHYWLPIKEQ